jgi:hypothetical protein
VQKVKFEATVDDEELMRIKELAILSLGKLFKETKDAKGMEILFILEIKS